MRASPSGVEINRDSVSLAEGSPDAVTPAPSKKNETGTPSGSARTLQREQRRPSKRFPKLRKGPARRRLL